MVDRLRQQSQQHLADIRYRLITTVGAIPEAIVITAQTYGASAIVMGKRGYRSLDQVLVGSVCQAVLETSPLPVVVVEDSY
jgi:nucleotide-binding universal stress UspA family protein